MRRPSIRALDASASHAAVVIAQRLRAAGHRAWIVGGAVRDLALDKHPKDVDLASAATPDEVERLFERTIAVGKSFGTIVVLIDGESVQLTTFRSERGYRDGRRPEIVVYGTSAEEDARRRDFTCNALYLDPLTDELFDPQGGLADLERRLLRCIGQPGERFREDGLRLVRMARLAAVHELDIEPATWAAAQACVEAIVGVSGERLLAELELIFTRPHAARAVRTLDQSGVLARALPGWGALAPAIEVRAAALEALGEPPGVEAGLAVLLDPTLGAGTERNELAWEPLERLKPSRALRASLAGSQRLLSGVTELEQRPDAGRARRIRLARDPHWPLAARLARAWRVTRGLDTSTVDALVGFADALSAGDKFPAPWIRSEDLERAGARRGAEWGSLLQQAETLQLDGAWRSRDEALAWLADQVGGNTRRSAPDTK